MTIAFRSDTDFYGVGTSTAAITVPAGVERNDVLLLICVSKHPITVFEDSPLFTPVIEHEDGGIYYTIATAKAGSSNPASYGFTFSGSTDFVAWVGAFSGGKGSDPVDVVDYYVETISSGGGDIRVSPTHFDSPTENNTLRVAAFVDYYSAGVAFTWSYGATERSELSAGSSPTLLLSTATYAVHATPAAADAAGIADPVTDGAGLTGRIYVVVLKSGTAPTVTSVTPDYGPVTGGETIAIEGTGFKEDLTEVEIDDVACTSVNVVSSTYLTCVTPAGTAGEQALVVYTDEGSDTY